MFSHQNYNTNHGHVILIFGVALDAFWHFTEVQVERGTISERMGRGEATLVRGTLWSKMRRMGLSAFLVVMMKRCRCRALRQVVWSAEFFA